MSIRLTYTILSDRQRTKNYLKDLESKGRWVMCNGNPASPNEIFDANIYFEDVVTLPVVSISDVIDDALREVDDAQHKVKLIAERTIINISD